MKHLSYILTGILFFLSLAAVSALLNYFMPFEMTLVVICGICFIYLYGRIISDILGKK